MHTTAPLAFPDNQRIAGCLLEAARRLDAQGANPFRVGAYRTAANTIAHLGSDIRALFDEGGIDALDAIPGVGKGIASAIAEMLITDRWSQLERLRGDADPAALFQTVPGIGPELAARIHDTLRVETLEDLELAARDGRLDRIEGMGPRRTASVRAALNDMLSRRRRWPHLRRRAAPHAEPDVSLLLEVDRLYREKAAAGALPTIAPRRLNPQGKAWLPVLHVTRDGWHFTALFSNTLHAHELGRVEDWVVLYFYNDGHEENQRTVVTETRGALVGQRVVRGRETECRAHYAAA
ncbi:helix-hairpin-helix domain-containing protein [Burkholderia ubonensis]|uniref:helix-hairpin-helix domain-containing protein n=1 Tax=Burkholderia ubonensis TaxID=101571 RepID=UPI0035901F98